MFRTIFKLRLHQKIVERMPQTIQAKNKSSKPPQTFEDYFKGKKFIVTGSCAGKLHRRTLYNIHFYFSIHNINVPIFNTKVQIQFS